MSLFGGAPTASNSSQSLPDMQCRCFQLILSIRHSSHTRSNKKRKQRSLLKTTVTDRQIELMQAMLPHVKQRSGDIWTELLTSNKALERDLLETKLPHRVNMKKYLLISSIFAAFCHVSQIGLLQDVYENLSGQYTDVLRDDESTNDPNQLDSLEDMFQSFATHEMNSLPKETVCAFVLQRVAFHELKKQVYN